MLPAIGLTRLEVGWYFGKKDKVLDQAETRNDNRERLFHRLRYSYRIYDLFSSNVKKAIPVYFSSRRLRGQILRFPAQIGRPFALSLPPLESDYPQVLEALSELNYDQVRMVISSKNGQQLSQAEDRVVGLSRMGVKSLVSLQQQREDVINPKRWDDFIREVFLQLGKTGSHFEIGNAWNLPGKGVYDHHEYLQLAHTAFSAAERDALSLAGPGIAGFRSGLYPSLLKLLPFKKITFAVQVTQERDLTQTRIEKKFLKKLSRLKATVNTCSQDGKELWISDISWPEQSEEEGSGFLIRFLVPVLSTGLVEKIFLPWQTATGSSALKILKSFLEDSLFEGRLVHPEAEIFVFCKKAEVYAVGWTDGKTVNYTFPGKLKKIISQEGDEIPVTSQDVALDRHPKYVVFEKD